MIERARRALRAFINEDAPARRIEPHSEAAALSSVKASGGNEQTNAQILAAMRQAVGGGASREAAMNNAAFNRCVTLIAGTIATFPVNIIEKVGDDFEMRDDHPVWDLLNRRPNQWQTPFQFLDMGMRHKMVEGNFYALKARGVGGRVVSLIPMNPTRTEPVQRENGEIVFEHMTKRGQLRTFSQKDVFHVRGPSFDGVKGVSVLTAARRNLTYADASQRHGQALFENGAALSGTFKHPKELSDAAYNRLKENLRDFKGPDNAGDVMLLEDGLDFLPQMMSSTDAQWLESRRDNRLEIYMHFGVPPHLAGDTEKATSWGTGIIHQTTGFSQYTLNPHTTDFEQAVRRDLLSDPKEAALQANMDEGRLLRGDIETRYRSYAMGRQWGWLNPNMILRMEGLPKRTDSGGEEFADPPNAAGGQASSIGDEARPNNALPEGEENDQ